jgi:hypothetical protein
VGAIPRFLSACGSLSFRPRTFPSRSAFVVCRPDASPFAPRVTDAGSVASASGDRIAPFGEACRTLALERCRCLAPGAASELSRLIILALDQIRRLCPRRRRTCVAGGDRLLPHGLQHLVGYHNCTSVIASADVVPQTTDRVAPDRIATDGGMPLVETPAPSSFFRTGKGARTGCGTGLTIAPVPTRSGTVPRSRCEHQPRSRLVTDEMMALRGPMEVSADADLLRKMSGFAAERLMEPKIGGLTGAAHGTKSAERLGLLCEVI